MEHVNGPRSLRARRGTRAGSHLLQGGVLGERLGSNAVEEGPAWLRRGRQRATGPEAEWMGGGRGGWVCWMDGVDRVKAADGRGVQMHACGLRAVGVDVRASLSAASSLVWGARGDSKGRTRTRRAEGGWLPACRACRGSRTGCSGCRQHPGPARRALNYGVLRTEYVHY